ncbi:YdcF family protein [Halobacillus fulvus]|nr:YdcF family protein [Halobacillus fulvus]
MRIHMKRLKTALLIIIGLITLTIITVTITFSLLGRDFLVIDGNPEPSEALIVLSGGADRLEKAADLYQEGVADTVILSNANEPSTTKQRAMELGIDGEDIVEETQADSTFENAAYTKDIMVEEELNSAVIITSDFHTRRTKMTFHSMFQGTNIELSYAVSDSSFSTEGSMNERDQQIAFREYVKLTGYWFRLLLV